MYTTSTTNNNDSSNNIAIKHEPQSQVQTLPQARVHAPLDNEIGNLAAHEGVQQGLEDAATSLEQPPLTNIENDTTTTDTTATTTTTATVHHHVHSTIHHLGNTEEHDHQTNNNHDENDVPSLPPLPVHPDQFQTQIIPGSIPHDHHLHHHHHHHEQQVIPNNSTRTTTSTEANNNSTNDAVVAPMVPQDPSFGFSYFAIRRGKYGLRSSIFLHWKDVERFIDGYDRAEYASFDKFDEAVAYLLSGGVAREIDDDVVDDDDGVDDMSDSVILHSTTNNANAAESSGSALGLGSVPAKKRKLNGGGEHSHGNTNNTISPFIRGPISTTTIAAATSASACTNHILTGHRRGVRLKAEANPNRKPTKAWEKMYQRYANYVKQKGTTDVDTSKENADLLRWTRQQQHEYRYLKEGKASSMFQVKIEKLRAVGFEFKYVSMEERVGALLKFKEKFGHYNIPETHPVLGRWVDEQKKAAKKLAEEGDCTQIFDSKIKEYISLGIQIDVVESSEAGGGASSDVGTNGSINTSEHDHTSEFPDHPVSPFPVGNFETGRTDDDKKWTKIFNDLVEYKKIHGNCEVPPSQHTPLSYWVTQQHKEYQKVQEGKQSRLTLQKVQQLTDIGFIFRQVAKSFTWQQRIEQLKEYRDKHGHTRVPKSDPQLGVFVNRQRYEYSKYKSGRPSTMTEERLKDLQALDFVFVAGKKMDHVDFRNKKSWEQRFEELMNFRDTYGHAVVPQSYPGLGEWVHSQRLYYKKLKGGKKSPLTNERLLKLADVGFVFDATKRRGNHVNDVGNARSLASLTQSSNTAAVDIVAASMAQQDTNAVPGFNPLVESAKPDAPNQTSV